MILSKALYLISKVKTPSKETVTTMKMFKIIQVKTQDREKKFR